MGGHSARRKPLYGAVAISTPRLCTRPLEAGLTATAEVHPSRDCDTAASEY